MKTVGRRSGLMLSGVPKSTFLNNFGLLLEVEIPNILKRFLSFEDFCWHKILFRCESH